MKSIVCTILCITQIFAGWQLSADVENFRDDTDVIQYQGQAEPTGTETHSWMDEGAVQNDDPASQENLEKTNQNSRALRGRAAKDRAPKVDSSSGSTTPANEEAATSQGSSFFNNPVTDSVGVSSTATFGVFIPATILTLVTTVVVLFAKHAKSLSYGASEDSLTDYYTGYAQ